MEDQRNSSDKDPSHFIEQPDMWNKVFTFDPKKPTPKQDSLNSRIDALRDRLKQK